MELLKNFLLIMGILLLSASLWPIRKTIASIPHGRIRNLWRALIYLICFFIIGYSYYYVCYGGIYRHFEDLLVPVVFFWGAVFVFLVCLLSLQTAKNFRRIFILEQENSTDSLTGVYNRRYFDRRLHEEFSRSKRYNEPFSMIMIDVDHFKRINDHWGHQIGDLVLRRFAERIKISLRESDVLCRYGGEELGLLLPHTPLDAALALAEKLRCKVAASELLTTAEAEGLGAIQVTVSLGVASLLPDISSPAQLLGVADKALYFAKQAGRNCIKSCKELIDGGNC